MKRLLLGILLVLMLSGCASGRDGMRIAKGNYGVGVS